MRICHSIVVEDFRCRLSTEGNLPRGNIPNLSKPNHLPNFRALGFQFRGCANPVKNSDSSLNPFEDLNPKPPYRTLMEPPVNPENPEPLLLGLAG